MRITVTKQEPRRNATDVTKVDQLSTRNLQVGGGERESPLYSPSPPYPLLVIHRGAERARHLPLANRDQPHRRPIACHSHTVILDSIGLALHRARISIRLSLVCLFLAHRQTPQAERVQLETKTPH